MFEKRCKGKRIYLKSQIFHYVFRKSVVDKNVSVCWKGYTEVYCLCQQKKLESAVGEGILLLKFMIFGSYSLVIYTVR
ncbi:hypothetical protein HMPREF9431_01913 [Segatella oulorum F0390]|uniref:Uncharacterized protein n=1 Tax=Segatella oulorum F0390 TaxID=702438 RepID=G1WDL2_9BACT|nr:hypothetical protein HMPREF9431_01913 [Segatella oulorum F0390]